MAGLAASKDPQGNLTANPFATGAKKFGIGQTSNATSGTLPKAGYAARDRKKKARSQAIQNILPKGQSDPNASGGKPMPPWLKK